jgi:hypothetical protein
VEDHLQCEVTGHQPALLWPRAAEIAPRVRVQIRITAPPNPAFAALAEELDLFAQVLALCFVTTYNHRHFSI